MKTSQDRSSHTLPSVVLKVGLCAALVAGSGAIFAHPAARAGLELTGLKASLEQGLNVPTQLFTLQKAYAEPAENPVFAGQLSDWDLSISGDTVYIDGYHGADVEKLIIPNPADVQKDPAYAGKHVAIKNDALKKLLRTQTSVAISYTDGVKLPFDGTEFQCGGENNNGKKLVYADLEQLDVSKVTSFEQAFYGFGKLETLKISSWDTSAATKLNQLLDSCYSLKNVDPSGWNVSHVVKMGRTFSNTGLEKLDLSNWDVSSVNDFKECFFASKYLKTPGDLSRWNTKSMVTAEGMFMSCGELRSIGDISHWDVHNLDATNAMFLDCKKLVSVGTLAEWRTPKLNEMESMFENCHYLQKLDLSNWAPEHLEYLHFAFRECWNLHSVGDIGNWDVSNVLEFFAPFQNCVSLEKLDLSGWKPEKNGVMTSFFACYPPGGQVKYLGNLSHWDIPLTQNYDERYWNKYLFYGQDNIHTLQIFSDKTTLSQSDNYGMFVAINEYQPLLLITKNSYLQSLNHTDGTENPNFLHRAPHMTLHKLDGSTEKLSSSYVLSPDAAKAQVDKDKAAFEAVLADPANPHHALFSQYKFVLDGLDLDGDCGPSVQALNMLARMTADPDHAYKPRAAYKTALDLARNSEFDQVEAPKVGGFAEKHVFYDHKADFDNHGTPTKTVDGTAQSGAADAEYNTEAKHEDGYTLVGVSASDPAAVFNADGTRATGHFVVGKNIEVTYSYVKSIPSTVINPAPAPQPAPEPEPQPSPAPEPTSTPAPTPTPGDDGNQPQQPGTSGDTQPGTTQSGDTDDETETETIPKLEVTRAERLPKTGDAPLGISGLVALAGMLPVAGGLFLRKRSKSN